LFLERGQIILYMVEGLNCAGKTTFINDNKLQLFSSSFANSRRWPVDNFKNKLFEFYLKKFGNTVSVKPFDPYYLGVYESLFYAINFRVGKIGWDRTWISAYVYNCIGLQLFNNLCELYLRRNIKIVWLSTPVEICKERYQKQRDMGFPRNYVVDVKEWDYIYNKFSFVMNKLKEKGFYIQVEKGY